MAASGVLPSNSGTGAAEGSGESESGFGTIVGYIAGRALQAIAQSSILCRSSSEGACCSSQCPMLLAAPSCGMAMAAWLPSMPAGASRSASKTKTLRKRASRIAAI